MPRHFRLGLVLLHAFIGAAQAQEPPPPPAPPAAPAEEERSTGLPDGGHWTFNLDAGLGGFGFANSLYTNAHPDPSGNLGDNWAESFVKPALSASFDVGKSELYGKASVVGERTFAAPPSLVGEDASSFKIEDAYLGWRSGKSPGTENLLDFTVGRTQYKIGHGFLLWDGGGEGGSRGGYWSQCTQGLAVRGGRPPQARAPYLRSLLPRPRRGPRERDRDAPLGGELRIRAERDDDPGATYLKFYADKFQKPSRDGLNVYNARAFTAPFKRLPDLSFELEYAHEDNGKRLESDAWTAQAGYELSRVAWKPKLSYRFAFFEGDDPATPTNEAFDSLLPGFYDWGTWWQGEIAGEYFVSNSNLISNQLRLHLAPSESVERASSPTPSSSTSCLSPTPRSPRRTSRSSSTPTATGSSTRPSR